MRTGADCIVRQVTIVLYGATGYTGRLVADELARRGLDHVLSGRDPAKLERLADERGAAALPASLDDDASLRALLQNASAVINCAGPFTLAGDALVRAAIATGTHYVDSTGEQPFIRMVFDRHGRQAERAGVALVSALGFDYAPGDCIARLTAAGLEPLEELVVAYDVERFGMSRGTLRSALEILKGGDVVYRDERWQPAPGGISRGSFDFPEPLGRRAVSRYPAGEVITVPHHTRTRAVTAMITNTTVVQVGALAPLLPYLMPGLALSLRTPLRGWLARSAQVLPEGPDEEDRRAAKFTVAVLARGLDGATRRGWLTGSDVYGTTARTLVEGAARLAEPGNGRSGALAPAMAFDAAGFLDALGLSWELG
jgi:short subunit dehydrogenase-like uncharacterized protein